MSLPKILFVCRSNRHRSRTAEALYKEDVRFEVKSAGISELADQQTNPILMEWADYIFVMETFQQQRLEEMYPAIYDDDKVFNLEIDDEYDFMDAKLVATLTSKFEDAFFLFIEN